MRTLIRWQPTRDFTIVRRQLDQLIDDIAHVKLESPFIKPQDLGTTWIPAVELKDQGGELVLRTELPGVDARDVDLQVSREAVSISGEHRSEPVDETQGFVRSEFRYGKFRRVIPLRTEIQVDQVRAEFKAGILTLTLPKAEAAKVVKINLAATEATETSPASAVGAGGDAWDTNSSAVE